MTEIKVFDAVKKIKFKRNGFYAQDLDMKIHRFKNTPTFNGEVWVDNLDASKKYVGLSYLCDDYAETVVFGDSHSLIEVKKKSEFIGE
ncbi:hypothetical protein [Thorsellia kenyensis]|uniref:YopX protein domain-containing protein n=1 Tax=Thorsellia kenyensis TaxID=1549888 RepID=A0ABV6CBB8_9GAMM